MVGNDKMSLREIKNNIGNFDNLDKNMLVDYVEELLLVEKRKESKITSLKTEIKFYNRQLEKIERLIHNTMKNDYKKIADWDEK